MSVLFDRLTATIERSLDFQLERGNVISANLANVDTPGYTPTDVKFDEQLQRYLVGEMPRGLARTDEQHLSTVVDEPRADVEFDHFALPNQDGNSVDLDHEMSKLSENQIKYKASTTFYNKRMALMKYAITEGGGQ
jgi:flagellar basal-body rod protein FlgB